MAEDSKIRLHSEDEVMKIRCKAESIKKHPPPRGSTHEMDFLYIIDEKGNEIVIYLSEKADNQLKTICEDSK